jgi:hypothetical protein
MKVPSGVMNFFVIIAAVSLAMPWGHATNGFTGGSGAMEPCNTTMMGLPDCEGASCSSTWLKCMGCNSEEAFGLDKEKKCKIGSSTCDTIGCTERDQHSWDDNCITQECKE